MKRVLITCMKEAGTIIREAFGSTLRIRKKSPVSLVTDVDMRADRMIISIIRKNFPDHGILTEESRPRMGPAPYRWIIDPLDGTTNFAHGIPLCCVSIGVEHDGEMILGGIYNPILKEFFLAERGMGATLNGARIRVSRTSKLLDSLLVTGFPYDRREKAAYYLSYLKALMQRSQGIRRLGAAALDLAYVASGRFEAFWELNLKPWDVAAGVLIVQEAGGRVTDFRGGPLEVGRPKQLLASNRGVYPQLLGVFRKIPPPPP